MMLKRSIRERSAPLLAAAALALCAACKPEDAKLVAGADGAEPAGELRTAKVQSGDFRISVSATGKVVPLREVEVMSKAGGEIIELPFDLGDHVKAGDLVCRLDPDDEQRNVQRAEAQLKSAQAKLEKARNELDLSKSGNRRTGTEAGASVSIAEAKLAEAEAKLKRQRDLFARNLVPQETLQTFETALQQAKSDVTRAAAQQEDTLSLPKQEATRIQDIKLAEVEVANADIQLADMRKRLSETQIHAPLDGVVTERKVERGQVISSPLGNVGGGTKIMIVSDLSELYLVTSVDESDIGGVKLGQRAIINADSFSDRDFEGKVARIAPTGIALNNVVTFDVRVKVEGEGLTLLKPGMTANVVIVFDEAKDALWVQSDAVQKDESGKTFVEVAGATAEETPRRVDVEALLTDGLRTQIKGVETGQTVVIRERAGMSAWERGEGVERPMKSGGFNPFKRKKGAAK